MKPLSLVAAALLGCPHLGAQEPAIAPAPVRLGSGAHTYDWVHDWLRLPDGRQIGNTHGCVVVDGQGRVLFNTDTEDAVVIASPQGEVLATWGKELKGGLHGMTLAKEGDQEFLYLAHTGRHEVLKTTLAGDVVWRLGWPQESKLYKDQGQYRPTSVAVAPNGDVYVVDGYGQSWVHHYDKDRKWLRAFGGRGRDPGKLATPHGIFLDERGAAEGKEPVLLVCDRENNRLQAFGLDGSHKAVLAAEVRRPCKIARHGDDLVVADLAGRVTILDKDNHVVAHLGDNPDPGKRAKNGVPKEDWRDGEFISPHSACWDADGNLYVMDWLALGRVSKLQRVEAKPGGKGGPRP